MPRILKHTQFDLQLSHYSKFEREVLHNALEVYSKHLDHIMKTCSGYEKVNAMDEFYSVDMFLFILRRISEEQNECDE